MAYFDKTAGKYVARVMVDGRRKKLGYFDKKRDAVEAEVEYRKEREVNPSEMTVSDLRDRWVEDYGKQAGWRESTRLHNKERTKAFSEKFGKRRCQEFSPVEAYRWASEHPGTVMAVRAMFNFGRKVGVVQVNPFQGIGGGVRKGSRGALTEAEVGELAKLARRMHGEWHRALILFAAYTGLRAGELYGLRFTDLGADSVTVSRAWVQRTRSWGPPKNGRERTVVLPRIARDALALVERGVGQEYVFVSPHDRSHLTQTSHYYAWYPLRDAFTLLLPDGHWLRSRVELDDQRGRLKFHELRHTAATLLLERGVPAEAVAQQLGHTDNGKLVLSTYGHPSEVRMLDQVRSALDRPVAGEGPVLRKVEGGNAS